MEEKREALPVRVRASVKEWLREYAASRGVPVSAVVDTALAEFMTLCESGVPEIVESRRRQSSVSAREEVGVGDCPKRGPGLGHVWASWRDKPQRDCTFGCGVKGREFFAAAGMERTEVFSRLKAPMNNGTGKAA